MDFKVQIDLAIFWLLAFRDKEYRGGTCRRLILDTVGVSTE